MSYNPLHPSHQGWLLGPRRATKGLPSENFDVGPGEMICFSVKLSSANLIIRPAEEPRWVEGKFFRPFHLQRSFTISQNKFLERKYSSLPKSETYESEKPLGTTSN